MIRPITEIDAQGNPIKFGASKVLTEPLGYEWQDEGKEAKKMRVTIEIPENTVKLQYATDEDGYESWHIVTFGMVEKVEKDTQQGQKGEQA